MALLLRFGPWVALALAAVVIWGLWGRLDAAKTKLAAAEAVIEQKEKDAKLSAELVEQQQLMLADLRGRADTIVERIHRVEVTRQCAQSPAMRAASHGVRSLLVGSVPDPGRQPAHPVPGSPPGR